MVHTHLYPSLHHNKIRMLVLETDGPHPDTQKTRGSFGQIFDQLFKSAGDEHDPPLGIETAMRFAVEPKGGSVPKVDEIGDDIRAVLVTGSMYDAHGEEGWVLDLLDLLRGEKYLYVRLKVAMILLFINLVGA